MMPQRLHENHELLTIDPGLRGCGMAWFRDGSLLLASYVPGTTTGRGPIAHEAMASAAMNWALDRLDSEVARSRAIAVEFPCIYPAAAQKGDQNDLLDVAGVASAVYAVILGSLGGVGRYLLPREWKGTVDKQVMLRRIEASMTADEVARVDCKGALRHNAIDACGIGLHLLGRLGARVYPS